MSTQPAVPRKSWAGFANPIRDNLVITSKFYGPTGPGPQRSRCGSRRHIQLAVEGSLRRLQTDRIDVYFIHNFDYNTPLEETLRGSR